MVESIDIVIDGQMVHFPNEGFWNGGNYIEEFGPLVCKALSAKLYLIRNYKNLKIGIVKVNRLLLPAEFAIVEEAYVRVLLEYICCSNCQWCGYSANPAEITSYLGVEDGFSAMKRNMLIPRVNCPNCTGSLPRASIWCEPIG